MFLPKCLVQIWLICILPDWYFFLLWWGHPQYVIRIRVRSFCLRGFYNCLADSLGQNTNNLWISLNLGLNFCLYQVFLSPNLIFIMLSEERLAFPDILNFISFCWYKWTRSCLSLTSSALFPGKKSVMWTKWGVLCKGNSTEVETRSHELPDYQISGKDPETSGFSQRSTFAISLLYGLGQISSPVCFKEF